ASFIVQAVAQAVAAVFSKKKGRARSTSLSSSSSSEATSSEDESEVKDKSVKRRRGKSVSKKKGQLVGAQVAVLAGLVAVAAVQNMMQKLILAITKKLLGYWHHSGGIEKILKQHHKTQRWIATINANPKLKAYNRARIEKNSKVNE
ncbi:19580_t:CDS:2, partial [Racocetra fulgida]